MNETIQNILRRRSIRKYRQEQISAEALDQVLLAGSYAPNAGSRQSPVMVVLQNRELIARLGRINRNLFYRNKRTAKMGNVSTQQPSIADDATIESAFYGAPTVVVVFVPKGHGYGVEDGSLVIGTMLIAAQSLGIGSCFIGRAGATFENEEARAVLGDWNIPEDYVAMGFCLLGYADGAPPVAKPRKEYVVKKIQ